MLQVKKAVARRKLANFEAGKNGSLQERATLVEFERRLTKREAAKAAKARGKRA